MWHHARIGSGRLLFAAAVLSVATPSLHAQRGCAECLRIVPEVQLSTADGPIVPSLRQSVARTGSGFLVAHLYRSDPQIARYDPSGRLIGLYERSGQGPGEFHYGGPLLFVGEADTVYAFEDYRLIRFSTVLDHIDTRTIQHRVAATAVILRSGEIVTDMNIPEDDSTAHTVSILSFDGDSVRRRGVEREVNPVGRALLAPSEAGGFWTLRSNDLWLREYSASGALLRSVRIQDETFEPSTERVPYEGYEVPPRPVHARLVDLGGGLVLVVKWVADAEWRPRNIRGGYVPAELNSALMYDAVLELVDAGTGDIIAEHRSRQTLKPVPGPNRLLFSTHEDASGHVITQIWRVEASRR